MKLKSNTFLGRTNSKFDLDLCTISIVNYYEPVSEEWHSHEDIHLSLILQGGNLESRKIKDTQVSPGKIMVYDQGEIHRNRFTSFPSKNLNLELKSDFFSTNHLNFHDLTIPENRRIETYLDLIQIYNEFQVNDSHSKDSIQLSMKSLFTNNKTSAYKPLWVNRLKEIIEDRWNEFIPLNELAHILNVHPVTISKYFKKHYKGTLGDYMRKVKVNKALYFLFNTNMSITEIAVTCGFSDHSHMIRIFKLYMGLNPKKIRGF